MDAGGRLTSGRLKLPQGTLACVVCPLVRCLNSLELRRAGHSVAIAASVSNHRRVVYAQGSAWQQRPETAEVVRSPLASIQPVGADVKPTIAEAQLQVDPQARPAVPRALGYLYHSVSACRSAHHDASGHGLRFVSPQYHVGSWPLLQAQRPVATRPQHLASPEVEAALVALTEALRTEHRAPIQRRL